MVVCMKLKSCHRPFYMVLKINKNDKMKLPVSLLFLSLLSLKMSGQAIVVKNVKPEHTLKEKFDFELVNTADSTVEYTVSIEQFITNQNRWCEIVTDVFRPAIYTSKRVHELTGKSTVVWHCDLTKAGKETKRMLPFNRCRLKVTDAAHIEIDSYSDTFIFK